MMHALISPRSVSSAALPRLETAGSISARESTGNERSRPQKAEAGRASRCFVVRSPALIPAPYLLNGIGTLPTLELVIPTPLSLPDLPAFGACATLVTGEVGRLLPPLPAPVKGSGAGLAVCFTEAGLFLCNAPPRDFRMPGWTDRVAMLRL